MQLPSQSARHLTSRCNSPTTFRVAVFVCAFLAAKLGRLLFVPTPCLFVLHAPGVGVIRWGAGFALCQEVCNCKRLRFAFCFQLQKKRVKSILEPSGHFRLYIYNSLLAAHMTAGIHPPDLIAPLSVQGKRAALPSATIMIRQPIQRFSQMQASDIDIYRNEIRKTNAHLVRSPRCRFRLQDA